MRHRFHAICPYFAMFPEAFAEKWIERLTKKGDYVLDLFSGRGTAPFQALLMDRRAVASDINPVAYCITKAKTNAPGLSSVKRRLTILERSFNPSEWKSARNKLPEFFSYAFHSYTLNQILYLRSVLKWEKSDTDNMIAAVLLGILHGEGNKYSYYLSNQMPRTISTKPAYSIKFWEKHGFKAPKNDVFEALKNRLIFRYESEAPTGKALVYNSDMRDLIRAKPSLPKTIKFAITSPPYLDITNFEEDQWLRLWFLNGPPQPTYGRISKDDRHISPDSYWKMIADMWRSLGLILDSKSNVVIRLGGKNMLPDQLIDCLSGTSMFSRRKVSLLHHEVSNIRRRQTDSFRPGTKGCSFEVDCHFFMN